MFERIGRLVVRHPRAIVAIFLFATPILALGINNEMRPVTENNLRDNDREVREYNAVTEIFPENDTAALALVCKNGPSVFSTDCLSRVRATTRLVETSTIVAADAVILSLTDYDYIETGGEDIVRVGSLVPEKIPTTKHELEALAQKVMNDHLLRGRLISNDGTATLLIFRLAKSATQNEVHAELARFRDYFDDGKMYEAGVFANHFQNRAFELAAEKEFRILGAVAFALIMSFMWVAVGFSAAILSLVAIGISIVWSLGILGWCGVLQNVLTSSLPVVLVAIISSPSFHLLERMRRASRHGAHPHGAVIDAFRNIVPSVFGSSVTTAFGFLSLMLIPVYSLAEFGLFATVGIIAGALAAIFLLPALALTVLPSAIISQEGRASQRLRAGIVWFLCQCKKALRSRAASVAVVLTSLLVILAAVFFALRVEVGSRPAHFIPKVDRARAGFDLLEEKFGGTALVPVMIDCKRKGGAHSHDCLQVADAISAYAETLPDVAFATSLADRVKRLNRVVRGGSAKDEVVPESAELIEQLLMLDDEDVQAEFRDESRQYLKLALFVYVYDSVRIGAIRDALRVYAEKERIPYTISFGGEYMLWARMIEVIGENGLRSPAMLGLFLVVFCGACFKSARLGILTLFPVGSAAAVVLALMWAFGIRIDIANVTVVTVAGAMTVDFYIHLANRVRHFVTIHGMPATAVEEALDEVGVPILFDCMTNLSFIALIASEFVPIRNLGWLLCVSMVVATIMTVTSVPAVMSLFPNAFFPKMRREAVGETLKRMAQNAIR